jgi:hypothetical protein
MEHGVVDLHIATIGSNSTTLEVVHVPRRKWSEESSGKFWDQLGTARVLTLLAVLLLDLYIGSIG